jgi:hypothetical protein
MATIHKISSAIISRTDFDGIQTFIDNYWGNADNEKVFSVPFWKMQELMAISGEVALRVREIDNTSYVNAEWVVFEDDMEGLLNDPVRAGEIYFVLDETAFLQLRANISTLRNPLSTVAIWGRLGKLTATGSDYRVFIVAAAGTPIPPGTGGDNFGGGIKIPAN